MNIKEGFRKVWIITGFPPPFYFVMLDKEDEVKEEEAEEVSKRNKERGGGAGLRGMWCRARLSLSK